MSTIPFPQSGSYVRSVLESSRRAREKATIQIHPESIKSLLFSPSFISSFPRLRKDHGMTFPLQFPSPLSELNLVSILSLLNFASGYRVPLHAANSRGAFDTIRAFVFTLYISSSTTTDYLSAQGMCQAEESKIAELMGLQGKIHVERKHESLPGLVVGELGGPIWELVKLVTKVMKETGEVLVRGGYPNLGAFVAEALKEGEKERVRARDGGKEVEGGDGDVECDVILERLVRAIPAFQDMVIVDNEPVYCFKKALLTIHAIALRYHSSPAPPFPLPRTSNLPVFSDNVLPSLLVHLGVIDLSTSTPSLGLRSIFPKAGDKENLQQLLGQPAVSDATGAGKKQPHEIPKEGPILTIEQAFILRAAAIDACHLIVDAARNLSDAEIKSAAAASVSDLGSLGSEGGGLSWLREITMPELDAWIWAVAKDRKDYRRLERLVLRDTPFF